MAALVGEASAPPRPRSPRLDGGLDGRFAPGMRSLALWALLVRAVGGAPPAPAEVPVVTIAPVAQAAPEASASAAPDPQAAPATPAASASSAPSHTQKTARALEELDPTPIAVLSGGVTTGLAVGPAAQGG